MLLTFSSIDVSVLGSTLVRTKLSSDDVVVVIFVIFCSSFDFAIFLLGYFLGFEDASLVSLRFQPGLDFGFFVFVCFFPMLRRGVISLLVLRLFWSSWSSFEFLSSPGSLVVCKSCLHLLLLHFLLMVIIFLPCITSELFIYYRVQASVDSGGCYSLVHGFW